MVDLHAQAMVVACHVQWWPRQRVLTWLALHGKLRRQYLDDPDTYLFFAPSGLSTGFVLREDGEFFIVSTRNVYWLNEGVFFVVGDDTSYRLR